MMPVIRTLNAVLDLLWPRRCAACSEWMSDTVSPERLPLCAPCASSLITVSSPKCPRCGLPYEGAGPDHLCGECLVSPPPFESLHARYQYGGAARDAVVRLKYGRKPGIAGRMGKELARLAACVTLADAVIPVPLHKRKLRERGFNQSALLAREIAGRLKLPLDTSSMIRVRNTDPQAGLSREDRLENIRGAFVVRSERRVRERRILLVDDVVTTGTTVREASKVLVESGARSVVVVAFARAG